MCPLSSKNIKYKIYDMIKIIICRYYLYNLKCESTIIV